MSVKKFVMDALYDEYLEGAEVTAFERLLMEDIEEYGMKYMSSAEYREFEEKMIAYDKFVSRKAFEIGLRVGMEVRTEIDKVNHPSRC